MACYDVSPYTCTYDSGGAGSLPGGLDPDYSTLSAWEAASDNDLSGYTGPVILDCYDSQNHDEGGIILSGATNTSATVYRWIRSSSSCATPWAGKPGTGANFVHSGTTLRQVRFSETNTRVSNSAWKMSSDYAGDSVVLYVVSQHVQLIGVYVFDSTNINEGYDCDAFALLADQNICYGCIADTNKSFGFFAVAGPGETQGLICCTSIGNGTRGFSSNSTNVAIVFSCYAGNNGAYDFYEPNWDAPSDYNVSGDETADLFGVSSNYTHNKDYWDGGADDAMDADHLLTASIAGGRNPYNDVTGTTDFNDFLRNDTAGDALFSQDIAGNTRPNESVADSIWDVGAFQFIAPLGTNYDVDFTLAKTLSVPLSVVMASIVDLTAAFTTEQSIQSAASASASLIINAIKGTTPQAQSDSNANFTLTGLLDITTIGLSNASAVVDLTVAIASAISNSALAETTASIPLHVIPALSKQGTAVAVASLPIECVADVWDVCFRQVPVNLTLLQTAGVSVSGQVGASANLTLLQTAGLIAAGQAVASAGLTLSNVLSVTLNATVDSAVFTLTLAPNRGMTVASKSNTVTIEGTTKIEVVNGKSRLVTVCRRV